MAVVIYFLNIILHMTEMFQIVINSYFGEIKNLQINELNQVSIF